LFDYLPPAGSATEPVPVGARVEVPFGRSRRTGLVIEIRDHTAISEASLKPIARVLDAEPVLPEDLMYLGGWAARYYHHPPGAVFATIMPTLLRQGRTREPRHPKHWILTAAGQDAMGSAPPRLGHRQRAVMRSLGESPDGLFASQLRERLGSCGAALKALEKRGLVALSAPTRNSPASRPTTRTRLELTPAQRIAIDAVRSRGPGFGAFLLRGVTGSGKTEVYLRLTEDAIARNQQVLILVPEIGLTPQLLQRFQERFGLSITAFHSGLGEQQRLQAWLAAATGHTPVVIGTRSAVFTPLARPGLIVVDEEHDPSLKQQDGFRYSGRDLAVMRARYLGVPVVLGSATPSLESLHNVVTGRYQGLQLPQRAGGASEPELELLDVRGQTMSAGISRALGERMRSHLERNEQILVFINRRGFAPTLLCHACGWVADCHRCDAHLTLHQLRNRLVCHHCGAEHPLPSRCAGCGSTELRRVGQGTERIEQTLAKQFPEYPVVRMDRDSTRRKGGLEDVLRQIRDGDARILVGTQMLAKGHHFPRVTLVAIVDADQGLLSPDYRSEERLAQLVLQVAGRAGRADRPGHVIIQTHQPTHPLLQTLVRRGYPAFAKTALDERQEAGLPPFASQALLRAESIRQADPLRFLEAALALAGPSVGVEMWGPVPAAMERKAGRWRAQLMVHAPARSALHRFLDDWVPKLETLKEARKVRWVLDVDPVDTL
jgi:primosomal protein N' (replication factor Y)